MLIIKSKEDLSQLEEKHSNQLQVETSEKEILLNLSSLLEKKSFEKLNIIIRKQNIANPGAQLISQVLKQAKNTSNLFLQLNDNLIGLQGVQAISDGLTLCQELIVCELDFYGNEVCDQCIFQLSKGLKRCRKIEDFSINLGKNQLSKLSGKYFSDFLSEFKLLKRLTIDFFSNKVCLEEFCQGVKNYSKELIYVNFQFNRTQLQIKDTEYLSYFIKSQQNIQNLTLNLNDNQIQSKGLQNLILGLKQCSEITSLTLQLNDNNICIEGLESLRDYLKFCENLKTISLQLNRNNIGPQGAILIGEGLEDCQSLLSMQLAVQRNNIGIKGISNFVKSIQKCKKLASVSINLTKNNVVSLKDRKFILKQIKIIPTLFFMKINF